jgi:hypothetical protein
MMRRGYVNTDDYRKYKSIRNLTRGEAVPASRRGGECSMSSVPSDVAVAKFWLLNRRRAEWSDTNHHELTCHGGKIEISERSSLDRARCIAYILSQAAVTNVKL